MIKANELRIGNLVKLDNYCKVIGVMFQYGNDNYDIHVLRENSILIYEVTENEINPIPLTPEILEKVDWNGYIEFNIGSYFKIDDVGHLYYRSDYSGVNIDYLHQLQNLYFALTGKELEIKAF